jgi:hypothetical protein
MSVKVTVSELPQCDFCAGTAKYDGKTIHGPWANMCQQHFSRYGIGLGTGKGQELVLRQPDLNDPVDAIHADSVARTAQIRQDFDDARNRLGL